MTNGPLYRACGTGGRALIPDKTRPRRFVPGAALMGEGAYYFTTPFCRITLAYSAASLVAMMA